MNVVKKWCDCDNRGYQGRRGPNAGNILVKLWESRKVGRIHKYVLVEVSYIPHWHGQVLSLPPGPFCVTRERVVCLTPPPRGTRAPACLSSTCWRPVCVPCRPSPTLSKLRLIDSVWSWKVRACCCQPGRYTLQRFCGPDHPLPLSFWPTFFLSLPTTRRINPFFLSFFIGFQRPNLINGLSRGQAPD